jgi:hypothetical protein
MDKYFPLSHQGTKENFPSLHQGGGRIFFFPSPTEWKNNLHLGIEEYFPFLSREIEEYFPFPILGNSKNIPPPAPEECGIFHTRKISLYTPL